MGRHLFRKIEYTANDTMANLLDEVCQQFAEYDALVFDNDVYKFKEFHAVVLNLAKNLRRLGISKNKRVAVVLPNCKEFIFLYFALMKIGAWVAPLSTRWEEPEIANVLVDCKPHSVIFADQIGVINYVNHFENIKAKIPAVKN